jgi:hypothetical protein
MAESQSTRIPSPRPRRRRQPEPWQLALIKEFQKNYIRVHRDLFVVRGRASQKVCVDCGDRAREWSYNNGGVDEVSVYIPGWIPQRYSMDLEQYDPRCHACHVKFDVSFRRRQGWRLPPRRKSESSRSSQTAKHMRTKVVIDIAALVAALPERPPLPRTNVSPAVLAERLDRQARLSAEPDPNPFG